MLARTARRMSSEQHVRISRAAPRFVECSSYGRKPRCAMSAFSPEQARVAPAPLSSSVWAALAVRLERSAHTRNHSGLMPDFLITSAMRATSAFTTCMNGSDGTP